MLQFQASHIYIGEHFDSSETKPKSINSTTQLNINVRT